MDLLMTYKIINGLVDMDMNYSFMVNANHTRSNGLKVDLIVIQKSLVFHKELSMIGTVYPTM